MGEGERLQQLQPVDALLASHTAVTLGEQDAARFLTGLPRKGAWADAEAVAVYGENPQALLGVGRVVRGELIPGRLLSSLEIQQILEDTPRP